VVVREFCVDSGKIPSDKCGLDPRLNRIQIGYFIKGTEPTESCDRHITIEIDTRDGTIAKKHTKAIYRRKISLVDYEREEELEYLSLCDIYSALFSPLESPLVLVQLKYNAIHTNCGIRIVVGAYVRLNLFVKFDWYNFI
jgi:hypothetical protein